MHQFSSLLINQNILDVSVTQANDVTNCEHKTEKLVSNSLVESKKENVNRAQYFKSFNLDQNYPNEITGDAILITQNWHTDLDF